MKKNLTVPSLALFLLLPALPASPEGSKFVLEGTDKNFKSVVERSKVPVLVDFWAPWCGPCRAYGPIVEREADRLQGKLRVVKVNVDENKGLARRFLIQAIPTTLLYRDGKLVKRWTGVRREAGLREALAEVLE